MKRTLAALVILLLAVCPALAEEPKELNIFSWSEYIPQDVVNSFTKETGIKVVLSTYESNEAMYAKLKLLQGKGYDLIIPSSYFVELLAQDGLLAPLDKSRIQGLENLDPASLDLPFDKGNALTVPYMWGSVGLLINKREVDPATITSWRDLTRPEFKGRVLLSDDLRDTFGMALKACGHSINSTNPEEIRAAYEWLRELKPSVRIFDVTATKQAFISEEVVAGFSWNGDAFIAMQENPDLDSSCPEKAWFCGWTVWPSPPERNTRKTPTSSSATCCGPRSPDDASRNSIIRRPIWLPGNSSPLNTRTTRSSCPTAKPWRRAKLPPTWGKPANFMRNTGKN